MTSFMRPRPSELDYRKDLMLNALNPIVIFVLGGPGAGKGTQCARLAQRYGFVHLSAGDLLRREESRHDSEHGALIREYLLEGIIVPYHITISLIRREMSTYPQNTVFLIDGFPREMEQGWEFEVGVYPAKCVLFFECPEEVMLERLLKRSTSSGRTDDNIESIKKRFKTFQVTSMPVVEWYDHHGMIRRIDCRGSPDQVFQDTCNILEDIISEYSNKKNVKPLH